MLLLQCTPCLLLVVVVYSYRLMSQNKGRCMPQARVARVLHFPVETVGNNFNLRISFVTSRISEDDGHGHKSAWSTSWAKIASGEARATVNFYWPRAAAICFQVTGDVRAKTKGSPRIEEWHIHGYTGECGAAAKSSKAWWKEFSLLTFPPIPRPEMICSQVEARLGLLASPLDNRPT
jgi:hypothetical protein